MSCLQLRLNPQQLDEKRTAEAAVNEIKELLTAETDAASKAGLEEELKARQTALDELMDGFEVGGVPAPLQEWAVQQEQQQQQRARSGSASGTAGSASRQVGHPDHCLCSAQLAWLVP